VDVGGGTVSVGRIVVLVAAVVTMMGALVVVAVRTDTAASDVAEVAGVAGIRVDGPARAQGFALWSVRDDGTAVRWDPCSTIDWVVATRDAPGDALALAAEAFTRVSAATGLSTRFLGATDEAPRADRPLTVPAAGGRRWAPVLVAWAPPHAGDLPLRDSDRGVSVPVAVDGVFVTGQIVLNAQAELDSDFGDRASSWGATLVHEIGHLVGLDHVDDPAQLMHRFPVAGPVAFSDGDLAGLQRVGARAAGGDCLDAGPPRQMPVTVAPRR
jgi:hypothetical protein